MGCESKRPEGEGPSCRIAGGEDLEAGHLEDMRNKCVDMYMCRQALCRRVCVKVCADQCI